MRSTLSVLALAGIASAHFELKYPKSVGNSDNTAEDGPCGGFTPDISDNSDELVDVHVGGEAIAVLLTHSRATWLFRGTLDKDVDDADWERLYPNTVQSGLGAFCVPRVTFPDDWAGKKGVISVVSSADDGQLFQVCIPLCERGGTGKGNLWNDDDDETDSNPNVSFNSASPPTLSTAGVTFPTNAPMPPRCLPTSPTTPILMPSWAKAPVTTAATMTTTTTTTRVTITMTANTATRPPLVVPLRKLRTLRMRRRLCRNGPRAAWLALSLSSP